MQHESVLVRVVRTATVLVAMDVQLVDNKLHELEIAGFPSHTKHVGIATVVIDNQLRGNSIPTQKKLEHSAL